MFIQNEKTMNRMFLRGKIATGIICAAIIFQACSVQKKISRSTTDILTSPALQAAHVGISIFEPATNTYWYDHQGDKFFVPASNTKIPTCYLGMKYLGDSLIGLRYQEVDSTIIIKPAGDPTFLMAEFKNQPTLDLLKKYRSIVFNTNIYTDHLGNGWSWNDYKEGYMAQRSDFPVYGNVARFTLDANGGISVSPSYFKSDLIVAAQVSNGFEIEKSWDRNDFVALPGSNKSATVPFNPNYRIVADILSDTLRIPVVVDNLGQLSNEKIIHSQPTDSMLKLMMHRSDNFYAEQTLLMVSNERLGEMNDYRIIDTTLKTDFADLPQKPRWVDGSGLSRYNLFTPKSMVAILNKMHNEFGMERIKAIFPTGGQGTISSYYKADSGYVYAKTGTLSGVVALSGFLITKKDKLLIFSVLVNNHQSSATDIRRAVEKFLTEIRNAQ